MEQTLAQKLSPINTIKSNPFLFGLAMTLCLLYLYFFSLRAIIHVNIETDSQYPGFFKVYWAGDGESYSENKMREILVTPHKSNYKAYLGNLGSTQRFRIDPIEYSGVARIESLVFEQMGYKPVVLDRQNSLDRLKPVSQISSLEFEQGALQVTTSGDDGQLELTVEPVSTGDFPLVHLVNVLLIVVIIMVLGSKLAFLFHNDLFVPICLLAVLILAATMAGLTGLSVHPDESAHLAAVNHYSEHLLPPRIDDPDIGGSFSVYGYTRLANFEMYYPLAGYFSWLIKPFYLPDLLNARIFGLVLLGIIIIWAFAQPAFRVFSVPLLISAQTWYLFSYANSEVFAIFLSTVVAYQAAVTNSTLNKFLTEKRPDHFLCWVLVFGLMVGGLLLMKSNFYFFVLFLGGYLLLRIVWGDYPNQKRLWTRLFIIGAIGMGLYGLRIGMDHLINGPDPGELRAQMIEQKAKPIYKPSTPLEQKHIHLDLRARGFSLDRIIHKEQWPEKSYLSAFGAYGFTEFFATQTFYDLVKVIGLVILAVIVFGILLRAPPRIHWLFILCAVSTALLIGMLLWRSWSISFQPQGRYLAPILPMLAILYYHVRPYINDKLVVTLTMGLFFLAMYSFIFIGLHDIEKYVLLI